MVMDEIPEKFSVKMRVDLGALAQVDLCHGYSRIRSGPDFFRTVKCILTRTGLFFARMPDKIR
jgi:hypothetical protein